MRKPESVGECCIPCARRPARFLFSERSGLFYTTTVAGTECNCYWVVTIVSTVPTFIVARSFVRAAAAVAAAARRKREGALGLPPSCRGKIDLSKFQKHYHSKIDTSAARSHFPSVRGKLSENPF